MLLVLVLEKDNLRPKDIYGGSGLGCSEVLVCVCVCVCVRACVREEPQWDDINSYSESVFYKVVNNAPVHLACGQN